LVRSYSYSCSHSCSICGGGSVGLEPKKIEYEHEYEYEYDRIERRELWL
jgi:hypothetical protein